MTIWRLVVSRFLTTDYLLVDIVSGWFNWSYSFWKLTGRMFRDNGSTHEIVSLTQWHELAAHRRWLFDTVQGWSPRRREDSRSIAEIIWAASILTCFSIFRPLLSLSLSLSLSLLLSLSLSFFVPHDRSFLVFGMLPSFRFTFVLLLFLSSLSRDREPRYARFASAPWTIICCFRSRGTIFNRSPLYDRFMCRIEQLTEIKTDTS